MSEFSDWEPEDSWSPGDPVHELLDNLCQRCSLLGEPSRLPADADHLQWVEELEQRLNHWRRTKADQASSRDQVRAYDIERHLALVRNRIEYG